MTAFVVGHATHPDGRAALALAGASIDAGLARERAVPTLGFAYFTDAYADQADALWRALGERWPGVSWVGTVGVGVAATGVEYFDEPALVLMLCTLPRELFTVFSGARPLAGARPFTALVHADPQTPDLDELIAELSGRMESGYLFGGVASSRHATLHIADGAWQGGLSGVGFAEAVPLVSRVTQGCQPIGPQRRITAAERNVVLSLDGQPALPLLLSEIGWPGLEDARAAIPRLQATLVGLSDPGDPLLARGGQFGPDTRVRHLVGIDPGRGAVAVADLVEPAMRLAFCRRDAEAARRDLVRICAEVRDEVESLGDGSRPGRIAGAIYVSCNGRGGAHFGGDSAELRIVQHALGDVPLAGFFAAGEIARRHLYGYTGVLTVFAS